jgi:hypothetical protein
MRRFSFIALLGLVLGLVSAPGAGATYYVGGGKGVRVAFRVTGDEVVKANVVARLYCEGPRGGRHYERFERNYASPGQPFHLDRLGGFGWDATGGPQEEAFTLEYFLSGRVSGGVVKGRYEYFRSGGSHHMTCQTGSFFRSFGEPAVRYAARQASGAEADLYVGGGKGIRVTFRVKGHELIQADVVARLYCVGRHGEDQFDRVEMQYATREDPLRIDRRGGFRWSTIGERQEEAFAQEELLGGRVGGGVITGRFEFFRSGGRRHTNCRTGVFPLEAGDVALRFRAVLRSSRR